MTNINTEITIEVSIPEHKRLLSFQNDKDALDFDTWWHSIGQYNFAEWIQNLKEDKQSEQTDCNCTSDHVCSACLRRQY